MPTTNSSIQFKHGLQEAFSSITKDSNTIYFITDTNRLFVGDSEYTRPVQHGSELPTSKNPANSLFVKETGTSRELYYSKDGTAWDMIAYLPATITGGVFGDNTSVTVAYGGTVNIPKVTVDNRGYVTAAEDVTITLPTSDKVTTVTTSGDGNAVTGGSISNDGATLTLTKGESFVPASGGTFSGDVVVNGYLTSSDININTTNIYGIIDEDYPERLDTSKGKITFVNGGEPLNNENPPTIEAEYEHRYAGPNHVYNRSYLRLNADEVETNNLNGFVFSYNYKNEDDSENGIIDSKNGIIQLQYNEDGTSTSIPSINIGYDHRIGGYYTSHVDLTARYLNLNGNVRLSYAPTNNMHAATKKYVDDSISSSVAASDAMVFKGTVGISGTVASISAMDYSTAATGDTYKVITADTLPAASSFDSAAHNLTPGDLIVYMGESKFIYVPSGDEDVTSVKVAGSGDTINVSTTAQTGNLVLGTAAGVNTTSTVTNDSTTVPTTAAVKTYVDNAKSLAMPKSGGTFTGDVTMNADFTAQDEITIASTDTQENLVHGQQHSDTKLIFGNANPVSGAAPMSIEGYYTAGVYGGHVYDASRIKINAGSFEACGLIVYSSSNDNTVVLKPQHDIPNREQNVETESIVMRYNVAEHEGQHDNTDIVLNASNIIAKGSVILRNAPTQDNHAVNKAYVKAYVDTALSDMTDTKVTTVTTTGDGNVVTSGSISNDGTILTLTKGESFIPTSGGTFTGAVTLAGAPTTDLNAATKKYVDDAVAAATLTWKTF